MSKNKTSKHPKDTNQLAKSIVDIATKQTKKKKVKKEINYSYYPIDFSQLHKRY